MSRDVNRRDFLKTAAVTGTVFLAGDIFQGSAFAQGSVKIPEAEKIVITVITDNLADALRPNYKIARRHEWPTSPLEAMLHAEHGLAYHIETVVNAQSHSFLFDFAADFQGVKKNIELLKLDLKRIEALALSHDHVDHHFGIGAHGHRLGGRFGIECAHGHHGDRGTCGLYSSHPGIHPHLVRHLRNSF